MKSLLRCYQDTIMLSTSNTKQSEEFDTNMTEILNQKKQSQPYSPSLHLKHSKQATKFDTT